VARRGWGPLGCGVARPEEPLSVSAEVAVVAKRRRDGLAEAGAVAGDNREHAVEAEDGGDVPFLPSSSSGKRRRPDLARPPNMEPNVNRSRFSLSLRPPLALPPSNSPAEDDITDGLLNPSSFIPANGPGREVGKVDARAPQVVLGQEEKVRGISPRG